MYLHSGLEAGFGNTNDGNTSRRFFANPECFSRITRINIDLIVKFKIIFQVISSGFSNDPVKFDTFALETAKKYVDLYGVTP